MPTATNRRPSAKRRAAGRALARRLSRDSKGRFKPLRRSNRLGPKPETIKVWRHVAGSKERHRSASGLSRRVGGLFGTKRRNPYHNAPKRSRAARLGRRAGAAMKTFWTDAKKAEFKSTYAATKANPENPDGGLAGLFSQDNLVYAGTGFLGASMALSLPERLTSALKAPEYGSGLSGLAIGAGSIVATTMVLSWAGLPRAARGFWIGGLIGLVIRGVAWAIRAASAPAATTAPQTRAPQPQAGPRRTNGLARLITEEELLEGEDRAQRGIREIEFDGMGQDDDEDEVSGYLALDPEALAGRVGEIELIPGKVQEFVPMANEPV